MFFSTGTILRRVNESCPFFWTSTLQWILGAPLDLLGGTTLSWIDHFSCIQNDFLEGSSTHEGSRVGRTSIAFQQREKQCLTIFFFFHKRSNNKTVQFFNRTWLIYLISSAKRSVNLLFMINFYTTQTGLAIKFWWNLINLVKKFTP